MKLEVGLTYHLTLTVEEFNVINRALRTTLRPQELEEAKELANHMAQARVTFGYNAVPVPQQPATWIKVN